MKRARQWKNRIFFNCPGCGVSHAVLVDSPDGWGWNRSLESPTFTPSVLVTGLKKTLDDSGEWSGGWELDAGGQPIKSICHSFVTDGRIQFLTDSTHDLAGQTVDLPSCE